jgi:hypothetical protein
MPASPWLATLRHGRNVSGIKRDLGPSQSLHLAVAGVTDNVAPRPDAVDRLGNDDSQ